jgi:type VI secretion system protein ImpA
MPWRTDLLDPIAGDNPSGADLRYDPIYDKIKEARREDDEAPQGQWARARKVADWAQVVKLSGDALATRSKDLQLAVWLTEAMLKRESLAGLRGGLELILGLLNNFWDTLYPAIEYDEDDEEKRYPDLEMRAAPLVWLGIKLDVAVKSIALNRAGHTYFQYQDGQVFGYEAACGGDYYKLEARKQAIEKQGRFQPEDFDRSFDDTPKAFYKQLNSDIRGSLKLLERVGPLCDEKFGDLSPSFLGLRKAIEDLQVVVDPLLAKKLELDPDPIEPDPVAEETGELTGDVLEALSVGGGAAAAPARAMTPEPTSRDDALSRVAAAAKYLRHEDPANPGPYLMLRGLRWGEVRASHVLEPKLLEAPATATRTQLKTAMLEARWPDLLEGCENAMGTPAGRGWIDLQRYAITACTRLGKEYHAVEAALRDTLRAYLTDVPKILEMTMMDDTPTANTETQAWLQEEIGIATGVAAAAGLEASADPAGHAGELARVGRTGEAVAAVARQIAQERSARGRFVAKTRLAAILVEAGQEAIATPILEELLAQIESFKLEEWESGEMVAEPLALMYSCLQKMNGDASLRQSLYLRICRLDALRALSCSV